MSGAQNIEQRLNAYHPKVIDLSLGRMERLLEALDHPEKKLPKIVHVAGTNAKGSVIATLQSVLEKAGHAVHCYTSPHIRAFTERIWLGVPGGGNFIEEDRFSDYLEQCEIANAGEPITFFEITTAAAFLAFADHPADYLLLEVGLGGRLDATNVIDTPALSVITPVDLDHQHFLGETIEQIALEKAGILKPGTTGVIGPQSDRALSVINRHAENVGAPLSIAQRDWQVFEEHGRLVYQDENGLLDLPLPKLTGQHQIENAGIAIAALRSLKVPGLKQKSIEAGLESVRWPARLERLGPGALYGLAPEGCEIWLDGGHNPAAGRALAASLADLEDRVPKPLILIVGMLDSKDPTGFLQPFLGLAARIVTVKIPAAPASYAAQDLSALANGLGFVAEASPSLFDALTTLKAHYPQSPRIVICGSLYLAGYVLDMHDGALRKMAGE